MSKSVRPDQRNPWVLPIMRARRQGLIVYFPTELLTEASTKYPEPSIEDYAETTRATVAAWKSMNGARR
jgi:hypothetical protein